MKREMYTSSMGYTAPETPLSELHLRRMRVADALEKLRIHLEDTHVAGMHRLRIVHGKGTGVLKQAVLDFLNASPLVSSHRMADPHEGGGGVTVVEMLIEEP